MAVETQLTFRITGMDCAACARTVETGVRNLAGVQDCSVNFTTETLQIAGNFAPEAVAERVRALGYGLEDVAGRPTSGKSEPTGNFVSYLWQGTDTRLAVIGAILILPGLLFNELLPWLGVESPLFNLTSVLAMLAAGYPVGRNAWRALRINREININVLMTIAAVGAVIIGAYSEAGLVMVLFAIGEALEGYTAARARQSIRSMMEVAPNEATVLRACIDCRGHLGQDGYQGGPCPFCGLEEQKVSIQELQVGEAILVRPGERIAMDGRITAGETTVNQAPITGESMPVDKAVGDAVFAGSINGEGVLQVEITRLAADNTISRMIQMIEQAQEKRAPAQRFIDRFARVYTPAVVLLALLVAILPPLLFDQPFWVPGDPAAGWLYRALGLLVVACPCALVISTPVTVISAITNAARNGVLIKGGIYLETLSRVRAIAFDKTGTLTSGRPAVVRVKSLGCMDEISGRCDNCDDLLAMAMAVEQHSEHPLARAIVDASTARGVAAIYPPADGVRAVTGRGVVGRVAEQDVMIGSHRYFDELVPHELDDCRALQDAAANGQTGLLISADDQYLGYITVADSVRSGSRQVISELRKVGVPHLVMLTGDEAGAARKVAAEVGMEEVRAGLLPEDKVAAVTALRDEYGYTAMVGDGINDAPALAAADVGIAMGAAGTAQALETADIALMSDDLTKLPFAVRLARAGMRTIRINVGFSLGLKALFLAAMLAGVGTMWMAVLADVGATLIVTLYGMRMLTRPKPTALPAG